MDISDSNTPFRYESLITGTAVGARSPRPPILGGVTPPLQSNTISASFQPDATSASAYVKQHQERLKAKIYDIGPKTQERLNVANDRIHNENEKVRHEMRKLTVKIAEVSADSSLSPKEKAKKLEKLYKKLNELRSKIKKPIQFVAITKKIEAIVNDSSLSKKEKKERIEEIRKEAGLTRREMREIFTGRLEKIYKASKKEVESYRKSILGNMQDRLQEVQRTRGQDSPEAMQLRSEIREVENVLKPYSDKLEAHRSFYKGLYGGKSCIKRTFGAIGNAFKKIGSFLKNVIKWSPIGLLGRIPVLKTLFSPILEAVNKVIDLVSQPLRIVKKVAEWTRDFFRNPWGTIKKGFRAIGTFLKRNWPMLTQLALNAIPGLGQALAPIAGFALRAYTIGKQVYDTARTWIQRPTNWIYEKVNGLWDNWFGSRVDQRDNT